MEGKTISMCFSKLIRFLGVIGLRTHIAGSCSNKANESIRRMTENEKSMKRKIHETKHKRDKEEKVEIKTGECKDDFNTLKPTRLSVQEHPGPTRINIVVLNQTAQMDGKHLKYLHNSRQVQCDESKGVVCL